MWWRVSGAIHHPTGGSSVSPHQFPAVDVQRLPGDEASVEATTGVRKATISCPPALPQHVVLAVLTGLDDTERGMYEAFRKRRDYTADRPAMMDGVTTPRLEGPFCAFVNVDGTMDSLPLPRRLLKEAGVLLAPGSGFGASGEGELRLSLVNSLDQLAERLD